MMDLFYNYIFKPKDNILNLAEKKPYLFTLGIVCFAKYSIYIASLMEKPTSDYLSSTLTSGFVGNFISFLFFLLLFSVFIHLTSRFFGGEGKMDTLFIALGISIYPAVLYTPVSMLFNSFGALGLSLLGLSKFLILIWIIYLQILAVKNIYNLSSGKASVAYFSPFILVISLLILSIILIMIIGLYLLGTVPMFGCG